jgi:hypothetical protein
MVIVILIVIVLLLGGVGYLWWKYGKKIEGKGGNSWWDNGKKKRVQPPPPVAEQVQPVRLMEKLEPATEVEITESDIANINRIPELITAIEGMAMALKRNGSKEISLEEALAQVSGPATLSLSQDQMAELRQVIKPEVEASTESKTKPERTPEQIQLDKDRMARARAKRTANASSVHQSEQP